MKRPPIIALLLTVMATAQLGQNRQPEDNIDRFVESERARQKIRIDVNQEAVQRAIS